MTNWWIIKRYDNFAGGWYPWSNGGWVHQRQKVANTLPWSWKPWLWLGPCGCERRHER
jgi:hypothetical protein